MILFIFKNIGLDTNFMIVCNLEGSLYGIFSLEVAILKRCHKMRLRGGKNWTSIFQAYLTPKEVKKAIKSILAQTFNFRHFCDIPHQTWTPLPEGWPPGGNVPTLRSGATSAGRRHETGCGTHAPSASPNLVVDLVKVRTVGWPQSWWSLVFHKLADALSDVLCGQKRCPVEK